MLNHCPQKIRKEILKLEDKVEAINVELNNGIPKTTEEWMSLVSDRNNHNQTIEGKKKQIYLLKSKIETYTPIFYAPPKYN